MVNVYLRKEQGVYQHCYVNNGVYQGLGCIIYDEEYFKPQLLSEDTDELDARYLEEIPTFIWGQTCDGIDVLHKNEMFPVIKQDEWMIYRNIGAYNKAVECSFNGFELPKTYYLN